MGDHTETLQIDYDPDLISYETLLEMAWNSHNPIRQPFSRQYMNIIFVHDAEQEKLARESKAALEQMKKRTVSTEIVSFTRFYPAEDYHQKYYLQSVPPLMDAFEEFYPQFQDFVDSTAAARINGYVAGHGDAASLSGELETLGLSTEGAQVLLERMKAWVL